ncbi:MAG: glycogen/starch synthase, partial [Candidatus Omnitrophica bacterium]|nr:glycogen/starch synthase [Candidatus Omnitrophota bacterium]
MKKTGQFAHVGLGRQYEIPTIYIDSKLYDDKDILQHENDEISQWEDLRINILYLERHQMRSWIIEHLDSPDEKLADTEYKGLTSRQIAKKFHQNSHSLGNLYEKYSDIDFEFDYVNKLYTLYGFSEEELFYDEEISPDLNISARGVSQDDIAKRSQTISWIEQNAPDLVGKTIVTLSMEGYIPEFGENLAKDANTKGGLGAYYGDKLEGLAAIGMEAYGIQPGYSKIKRNDELINVDYKELIEKRILEPVCVGNDAIKVWAWAEDPILKAKIEERGQRVELRPGFEENVEVDVEVYRVNRGGTWDYILFSDVIDQLYSENRVHRFTQEIVYGKAVYKLLKRLNLIPDILHLNEAHTVVAAGQMRADRAFDKTAIVYTNHTIIRAGLERFFAEDMGTSLNRMMYQIGLSEEKEPHFRSVFLRPDGVADYCYAAVKLADVINGVSDEHAGATERFFKELYGEDFDIKVIGILNGSGITWKSDALQGLEKAGTIPDEEELWSIHEENKRKKAFSEIEKRTGIILNPDKPTVWAVRRLVEYKSQYPILRFLVHLICADKDQTFTRERLRKLWMRDIPDMSEYDNYATLHDSHRVYNRDIRKTAEHILDMLFRDRDVIHGLGMQLVLGGAEYEKWWVKEFTKWTYDIPELKDRVVYVPHSDVRLLKMQAVGSDICICMPRDLEEACETSGQRAGGNGGVDIALNGAGPREWMTEYDESQKKGSGFFFGPYTVETPQGLKADNVKFYNGAPVEIFEKLAICSRLFYEDKPQWKHLMHNSYMATTYGSKGKKAVTAKAMEQRYALHAYIPALKKRESKIGSEGHPAACLRTLYDNRIFKNNPITIRELSSIRRFSSKTVRKELHILIAIGLVKVGKLGRKYVYYLSETMMRVPSEVIDEICSISKLSKSQISLKKVPAIKKQVKEILQTCLGEPVAAINTRAKLETLLKVLVESPYRDRTFTVANYENLWGKAYPHIAFSRNKAYKDL